MDETLSQDEVRQAKAIRAPFCLDPDDTTILVVDDSPVERRIIQTCLDRLGWPAKVAYAADGEDGWEKLQALEEPVVVLTDLEMPVLDGMGLVQKIRADPKTVATPTFMISSKADAARIRECMAAGATAFFPKPGDPGETFTLVKVLHAFSFHHCFTAD